jgi:hypothetical protein
MKIMFHLLLLIAPFLFLSCKNANSPDDDKNDKNTISIDGYGSSLGNSYYKLWSDDSWEQYNGIITINSETYLSLITNTGNEYYYSAAGYAGFKPYGESLILFNTPIGSLPDKLSFNQKYIRETIFSYQGYNYTMKIEEVLMDTVTLSVPCGTFNSCLWFKSTSTLTSIGQPEVSKEQFWLAIGPSDIQEISNSGVTKQMVSGTVNGQDWDESNLNELPYVPKIQKSFSLNNLIRPIIHSLK